MSKDTSGIRIVAVKGSVRPGNATSKVLEIVADEIRRDPGIALDIVDPATLRLPFPGEDPHSRDAREMRTLVAGATGVILSTPEYHGGYSSVIKLVIENLGFPSALAGKPVALLGVAAGQIGAIKSLEALRSVCSHVGALVLPGPVSVANVRTVLDDDGTISDERIERRVRGLGRTLIDYIRAHICPAVALEAMVRGEAPGSP
jgi:chromate reductase